MAVVRVFGPVRLRLSIRQGQFATIPVTAYPKVYGMPIREKKPSDVSNLRSTGVCWHNGLFDYLTAQPFGDEQGLHSRR